MRPAFSISTARQYALILPLSLSEGWAVGGATIYHYTGSQWQQVDTTSNRPLSGQYMTSPNEGWSVGMGTILHYHNGVWSKYGK